MLMADSIKMPAIRKKSFGYMNFAIHICTSMKLQLGNKHWWWHTSS
jgi:hypothetical protein